MERIGVFIAVLCLGLPSTVWAQQPEIKWWFDLNDSSFGNAAAADIDEDGLLELVFGCYRNDSMAYALNAEDGSLLWKQNLAGDFEGCNDVAVLIYDLDQNGTQEVVVPGSCNPKTFCFDGATGTSKWTTSLHGSDSPPSLSDLDEDGRPEILHGNFNGSVTCLNGEDGSVAWELLVDDNATIQTAPTILDADRDGKLDFIVASWSFGTDNRIYCYRAEDQQLLWESKLPEDWMYHGAAIADLDKDQFLEMVIGSYDGSIYALNVEDGSLYWRFAFNPPGYVAPPVSIGDINGDQQYEVIFFDTDRIGALSHDGQLLWTYSLSGLGQSFRGAALSDISGDGIFDLVFGADNGILYALDGKTGTPHWTLDLAAHYGSTDFDLDHGPIIADFDEDGSLDIFVVGGHTIYPEFENNYGRAYAISTNANGMGPDWLSFRRDSVRSGHVPLSLTSSVSPTQNPIISDFKVKPNPSIPGEVHLEYSLEENSFVVIQIYDFLGRKIAQLSKEKMLRGSYTTTWNAKGQDAGCYLVTIKIEDHTYTQKVILTTP